MNAAAYAEYTTSTSSTATTTPTPATPAAPSFWMRVQRTVRGAVATVTAMYKRAAAFVTAHKGAMAAVAAVAALTVVAPAFVAACAILVAALVAVFLGIQAIAYSIAAFFVEAINSLERLVKN